MIIHVSVYHQQQMQTIVMTYHKAQRKAIRLSVQEVAQTLTSNTETGVYHFSAKSDTGIQILVQLSDLQTWNFFATYSCDISSAYSTALI